MKKIAIVNSLIISILCGNLYAREITDMAGRKVNVPDKITRVVPFDNKTNVLIYPVAEEKMIVKARAQESPNLRYVSKDFLSKKEIDTKNVEEVMKQQPDIIMVGAFVDEKEDLSRYIAFAERINVPLVVLNLDLMSIDKTYEFMGELLGKEVEASKCAEFIRSVYSDLMRYKKGKKVVGKAYMANDNNGLRTTPKGSKHAQLFDVMGIVNAVEVPLDTKGFAFVSIEQVMVWNPDYIFCVGKGESSPYRTILKSNLWKTVTAVKNKRCFYVPSEPCLWFDMPPSINRMLGIIWFSDIFYAQPNEITREKVKAFYSIFYHYDLSDKEYARLFIWH